MLELNNFSNEFITNSDFMAKAGEITAIIGANGSGKTTLAKYIAGIYDDYQGEIKIAGDIVSSIRSDVALLLQNPYHQFVGVDVFDEVTYNLEQNEFSHEDITNVLTKLPVPADERLLNLSGGQAQNLLIFNYLQANKAVFIFDETFSNLDSTLKKQLFEQLRTKNKVIILITNNIYDLQYVDVTYQLKNKELICADINYQVKAYLENNKEISIRIERGSNIYQFKQGFNIVTGSSGCGKSTLLKEICGINKTKATISIEPSSSYYIGQYPFVQITDLRVGDMLELSSTHELIKCFGFEDNIYQRDIVSLSTGELVQIMVIKALVAKQEYIFLDEALEVLDYDKQQLVLKVCQQYVEKTFVFVTHNPAIYGDYPVHEVMINEEN